MCGQGMVKCAITKINIALIYGKGNEQQKGGEETEEEQGQKEKIVFKQKASQEVFFLSLGPDTVASWDGRGNHSSFRKRVV